MCVCLICTRALPCLLTATLIGSTFDKWLEKEVNVILFNVACMTDRSGLTFISEFSTVHALMQYSISLIFKNFKTVLVDWS